MPETNPVGRDVRIRLELPLAAQATLTVHDVRGRLVRTLHRGPLAAGRHRVAWDARDRRGSRMAAGVYFLRLTTRNRTLTRKIVLLD
jgi:flagellar hook assembly protein FlgD